MIKNRIMVFCILMITVLLASYVSAQEVMPPNCGGDICTDVCQDTGESDPEGDTWNFYCTGPGDQITECGNNEDWWKCCCEVAGPEQCAEIWDVPFDLETIKAKCEGEIELESPEPTLIDSITRCYPEEKSIPIDYNAVYAEINSVKVNGEEQLLEGQTISTRGALLEGGNYYKYYATKRFSCATPQNPEGEGDEEIYCEVEIDVPVYNENVKILILDSDFSSTPCIITKEEEEKDLCLDSEKSGINFKDDIIKVSNNEEKTIDIKCDQNLMIRPFLKTTSQRWTEVCENPAVMLIQEYKTGTNGEGLKTIFDWQRVDVDEWENAYLLDREQCKLEEKMNSLEVAYRDTELTWEMVQNRENCNFEPVNDRCYWIEAKAGTTLTIKVADATDDSFIEIGYRNCDCYCNEEKGISCDYEADTCSPPALRDLECPDLLTIDCTKHGDWPYIPDGLPSCGGRGGGYSGSEDVDYSGWIDLGDPYDTNLCLGPGPLPNYCARRCSVERDREKESNCFGDDPVKQSYWGSCRGEASCYPGYISLTGQQCTGKPEEANCVFGCVWDNECLDCTGRPDTECYDGLIPCNEWTGEPTCECLLVVECEEGQTLNEETCICESPEEEPLEE